MRDYKTLNVWQEAHDLVRLVYKTTESFPKEEKFGLTSQLRRAVVSIPTNIAEGCGREGDLELKRFLQIAMGSASESDYLILLAKDLDIINNHQHSELAQRITRVMKMLSSFIKKIRADIN